MKQKTDNERLLADVLHSERDSECGVNVLAEILRGVRRQRRIRDVRRCGSALALLVAVSLVTSHFIQNGAKRELARIPEPTCYQLVTTRPLASDEFTSTRSMSSEQQIVSAATVNVIQTTAGGFGEIGDDE